MATTKKRTRLSTDRADTPVSEHSVKSPDFPENRYDLQILRSIRRIMRSVDTYSRKLRTQCKLTVPQLVCLGTVADHGPLTVSEIAHRVFLSPSTVVGILDRLESRRLITRQRDTIDRRAVNIKITAAGSKVIAEAPSALQDGLHQALRGLPMLEQATIALSLKRVVDLMEAGHLDAAPILETAPIDNADLTRE